MHHPKLEATPPLARFVTTDARVRGLRIGALYTLNTLGAVAGCFLTGFVFIERFGYLRTTLIGAAANLGIGLLALAVAARVERVEPEPEDEETPLLPVSLSARHLKIILAAYALSGACALALEVLWTRLLIIVFLGTTYAYTTMLTTLLCGLVAGGALASLVVDRLRARVTALGGVLIFTGVSCVLMLGWIAGLPQHVIDIQQSAGMDWAAEVRGKFWLSFAVLFLPTCGFGATFPLVVRALSEWRATLGRDVGRLYSANTFGGMLGALAGGYVIIPLLGAHRGIVLLAALLTLAGVTLMLACPVTRPVRKRAFAATGILLFALALGRAPGDVSRALNAGYIPADHRVLHYHEGVEGTVAVSEPRTETHGANRVLWINRVQATTSIERGVRMNRFEGILPLLFDRDPREVLFMCFGSGITCGTLALSSFDHIDAVEICRDVLDAAPFFAADNFDVLHRKNVQFHIDDGRNFLLTTPRRYDVISFEPMPLALAGVSTFYTREYYLHCLDCLNPGGLVSQWIPLHSLDKEVVRALAHTFTAVFPEYCAWFINADLFLIGSNRPLHLDYAKAKAHLDQPELKAAAAAVGFNDPEELFASFLMDKAALDAYAADGRIMTDDRPWAEFIAPKLVYARSVPDAVRELAPRAVSPLALFAPDSADAAERDAIALRYRAHVNDFKGLVHYYTGMTIDTSASDAFKESLRIDARDANAQHYLKQITLNQGKLWLDWKELDKAESALTSALEFLPNDPELSQLLNDVRNARVNP
jgi:spermidine synthase